jgi:2-dehydro-3-deoxygluconokinase
MKAPRILCIGEPLVELFETKEADGVGAGHFGGKPIPINGFTGESIPNLASFLRETLDAQQMDNAQVELFTAIGDDDSSNALRGKLESLRLGTDNIKIIPGGTLGSVTNMFDKQGNAVHFSPTERFKQQREHSATRDMLTGMSEEDMRALLKGHSHLVVSAVGLGCARDRGQFIRLMELAKEQGIKVIFSTNIRPAVWKFDGKQESWKQEAQQWIAKALPHVDIILASHSDEKLIFGDDSAEKTRLRLKDTGIAEIVVTDGAGPLLLAYNEEHRNRMEKVTFPARNIAPGADDSGAGDAFAGGYIASRIAGKPAIEAARMGAHLGAQMLDFKGAFPPEGTRLNFTPPQAAMALD